MFTINLEDGREAPSKARKKGAKRLEFLVYINFRITFYFNFSRQVSINSEMLRFPLIPPYSPFKDKMLGDEDEDDIEDKEEEILVEEVERVLPFPSLLFDSDVVINQPVIKSYVFRKPC